MDFEETVQGILGLALELEKQLPLEYGSISFETCVVGK